jgi:cyclic pyranopterin phosphate synthase
LRSAIRHRWQQRDDRYSDLREDKHAAATGKSCPTVRMSLVGS